MAITVNDRRVQPNQLDIQLHHAKLVTSFQSSSELAAAELREDKASCVSIKVVESAPAGKEATTTWSTSLGDDVSNREMHWHVAHANAEVLSEIALWCDVAIGRARR